MLDWDIGTNTAHELLLMSKYTDTDPGNSAHSFELSDDGAKFTVTVFNEKQSIMLQSGSIVWYFYNKVIDENNGEIFPYVNIIIGRKPDWEIYLNDTGLKLRDLI